MKRINIDPTEMGVLRARPQTTLAEENAPMLRMIEILARRISEDHPGEVKREAYDQAKKEMTP